MTIVQKLVEQGAVVDHRAPWFFRGGLMTTAADIDVVGGAVVVQGAAVFNRQVAYLLWSGRRARS